MLVKLVFKLIFKATIPIVCVVGVLSYGMYLRGGDPGAMFKKLAGSAIQSAKSSIQGVGGSLKSVSPIKSSNKTTVYKWVDANGIPQFGSTPPAGVNAKMMTFDSNTNVLQAQKPRQSEEPQQPSDQTPAKSPQNAQNDESRPGFLPNGERMPGVAGMNLPTGADPSVLSKFLQTMQESE